MVLYRSQQDIIIQLLKTLSSQHDIIVKFGVEVEFYMLDEQNKPIPDDFANKILAGAELTFPELCFCKEKGKGQYEFSTKAFEVDADTPYQDHIASIKQRVGDFISDQNKFIQFAKKVSANYDPKPFIDDYGSSMHVHLTLHPGDGLENIFEHCFIDSTTSTIVTNKSFDNLLLDVITSILHLLNPSIYLILGDDESEYQRLQAGYMAPINVSWGGNNRTTAIRIPSSPPRRLEFRVPSASSSFTASAIFFSPQFCIAWIRSRWSPRPFPVHMAMLKITQNWKKFVLRYKKQKRDFPSIVL